MSALAALRIIERGARTVLTTFFTLLGSSKNDEDESSENVTKKWICVLSWRLSGLAQFVKCGRFFQELNSKGLYPGSKRERKIRRHMFMSSIKRRIRRFDVVVEQSKKCTKKREWCTCRAVVLLIKRIVFFLISCSCRRRRRGCLSSMFLLKVHKKLH